VKESTMTWILFKYLLTAAIVVLVSEVARQSPRLGGMLSALPLVTLLTLVWLNLERQPQDRIADYARYTFWYVIPTLPMFLAFPVLLPRLGFWPTLIAGIAITVACFAALALMLRRFGIELL